MKLLKTTALLIAAGLTAPLASAATVSPAAPGAPSLTAAVLASTGQTDAIALADDAATDTGDVEREGRKEKKGERKGKKKGKKKGERKGEKEGDDTVPAETE